MKNHIQLLWASFMALLLWGCTSGQVHVDPTLVVPSPLSRTAPVLPSPYSTEPSPAGTVTEPSSASTTPLAICQPGELEAYLAEFTPVGDQIVLLAQEATKLEELSDSRATEMSSNIQELKSELNLITFPACLETAHKRAIDAVIQLESGVNAILEEDFDRAKEMIQESFLALSEALAKVGLISWELTATSTPGTGVISSSTVENLVLLHTFSGHSGRVLDVAFSAGGELIVSSGQDLNIKLWDVKSGQELHSFRMVSVDMSDIDINTAKNLLASGEAIWNLESMQEIHTLERGSHYPAFVAFSPDGSELALGLFDKQIDLWDVTSGQPVYSLPEQGENRTKSMDFSPDGTLLAVGVYDGTVRLWDIESRQYIKTLKYSGETDIHDVAFSPDGYYLASGGRMPAVILWNVASGEVVKRFRLTDNLISLAFSPDGTLLASTGGYEHAVHIWDVTSGNLLHSLPHDDQLMSVAFSPDGRFLAAGGFDSQVYLWGIPLEP